MRTQTKYIDTFVAAMETGSFVRAAEQLHVTPSTVSYQIKQLETWLGAALFERSGRRVLPSATGERLFAICGSFIDELGTLRAASRGHDGSTRQALRIATGSSFGRYVLTPILSRTDFADTIINLRFGPDDEVCDAIAAGRADIGFSYSITASNSLSFDLIYRYPLVLIAPYSAVPPPDALQAWIAAASFITYDDCESTFNRWFDSQWGALPSQLRTTGRCTELEETVALVAAGRGLSIVPGYMLAPALRQKRIRAIVPPGSRTTTDTVYRVTRNGTKIDATMATFIAALTGELTRARGQDRSAGSTDSTDSAP